MPYTTPTKKKETPECTKAYCNICINFIFNITYFRPVVHVIKYEYEYVCCLLLRRELLWVGTGFSEPPMPICIIQTTIKEGITKP